MLDTIFGENSGTVAARALLESLKAMNLDGTLYLGYPVLSTADAKVIVDALLTTEQHGLVAFDLSSRLDVHPNETQIAELADRQDQIYASLYNKLNTHRGLRRGRDLALTVNVITCHTNLEAVILEGDVVAMPPSQLSDYIGGLDPIAEDLLKPLNAAIQRVSTLRPMKRRENVTKAGSRGSILKKIEKEIANLDQWQNRGAIEYANGPQRIRGLAGSGKTVVLALKAAYLHARHPEWKIAVTFQSRSLYQQFRDLIRRFIFDQIEDEPDWNNLQVMHAWGSAREQGIYSTICAHYEVAPLDWKTADARFGNHAFEGVCKELGEAINEQGPKKIFDAVLIDEAQDFPTEFFRMVYEVAGEPHRIMWAYDDLQNLGDYVMPSEQELFGNDPQGHPRVSLRNDPDKPKEDIVLPVCYRNTPWTLATAHALGFGIYRPEGLIQMFEEPYIWPRIGYELKHGELTLGRDVAFARSASSYPEYFVELLNPADAIQCGVFGDAEAQFAALASSIRKNLQEDELDPTDIMIVLPSAYTSRKVGAQVMSALAELKIASHLVGVTTSRDEFFLPNSVAITHIFRAKGNEAPMVYIVNAEYGQIGFELNRKRNILFTAITRSRCWVRLFGVGDQMKNLALEVEEVRKRGFELQFRYPTEKELKNLARVHRDMSAEERKAWESKFETVSDVISAVLMGDIPIEALPPDVRKSLDELTRKRSGKKK